MEFIKGQAVVGFPFGLVKKADGENFTDSDGTPSVYITIDGNDQAAATNTPDYEGNGQWTVNFNGNETDGNLIGIVVTHADVISEFFTIKTTEPAADAVSIVVNISSSGTSISNTFEYYGTLTASEFYFDNRLGSDKWTNSTVGDQQKALIQATRAIEKLNYGNDKTVVGQNLQFPRGDDTTIPVEIEYACYEIAIKLLEGYEPDVEADTLGILSETYSGVRYTYDGSFVNDHIRAGIPSIEAWLYLKPFLLDPHEIKLSRVN